MSDSNRLSRSTPEAQGVSSSALSDFVTALCKLDTVHSVMVLRHGHVLAEGWQAPFRRDDVHMLWSLSKSFTSTAIGLLVDQGRLSVDDPVLKFFPEDAPTNPSEHLRAMKVRHLLSMSTGHSTEPAMGMMAAKDITWVQAFLAHEVTHTPGSRFLYNTPATYMLSAIVHGLTGSRLIDFLRPRLLEPLGINKGHWDQSPEGIDTGGYGYHITTEAIAAFGQLYLQKGMWQGKRLISEAWVDEATAFHVQNAHPENTEWSQGYGYQFWRCRHNAYRGDGAFGQYCVVLPDQDAVVAITSGLNGSMQVVMDLIWAHLLPAFAVQPLAENSAAHGALIQQLASMALPRPDGTAVAAAHLSSKTYLLGENAEGFTSLRLEPKGDRTVLHIGLKNSEAHIDCGHAAWLRGNVKIWPQPARSRFAAGWNVESMPIAASGAWTDADTFTIKIWWTETSFARTMVLRFAGDSVQVSQHANASFWELDGPTMEGKRIAA